MENSVKIMCEFFKKKKRLTAAMVAGAFSEACDCILVRRSHYMRIVVWPVVMSDVLVSFLHQPDAFLSHGGTAWSHQPTLNAGRGDTHWSGGGVGGGGLGPGGGGV